jgi:hypothetical protein
MNAKFLQINKVDQRGTQMLPKLQRLLIQVAPSAGNGL